MSIEIRRATPSDSTLLTEIAHAAKRHWGYPERWIIQWKEVLTITPEFVSTNEVYVATQGATAVGFYALLFKDGGAVLEHMWVDPGRIGAGIGRALFDHAFRVAASFNAAQMEIESDPNAEGFYLRMGARRAGEVLSVLEGQTRALPLLIIGIRPSDAS
jgi:GNAT superfamily N-acetyltransferase